MKLPFYQPPGLTPCERVKDAFWLGVVCVLALTGQFQIIARPQGR